MKRARLVFTALVVIALAGAGYAGWRWRTAAQWRTSVPWPAKGMTPGRPWTAPLQAAHAEASRWPVDREAVEKLTRLYLANGFNAEAALLLPGVIARRPTALEWVHRRAVLLADSGQLTEAVILWEGIRETTKQHLPVRVKQADALTKLNRGPEAEALYRELLQEQPGYPYAWSGLVRLDLQQQRWEDAREKLSRAIALAPDFYGHYALLEAVARHFGDTAGEAEADRQVKRLGRFRDVPDAWMEAALEDCFDPYRLRVDADRFRSDAELGDSAGGLAKARARLDRAIALAPTDAMNYQLLATIEGVAGDEAAAERAYVKGLELDPRSATLYVRYGNLLSRQGRDDTVRALLSRGAEQCPEDASIATMSGDRWARAGRWKEAAAMYQRVMTLRPDLADIGPKAAMASFRSGDEAAGLATLQENLRRHPRHEQTLGYLIMHALQQGNDAEARELLARLTAVAPDESATRELQRQVRARFGDNP